MALDGADLAIAGGSRYAFAVSAPSSAFARLGGGLVGEGLCNRALDLETIGAGSLGSSSALRLVEASSLSIAQRAARALLDPSLRRRASTPSVSPHSGVAPRRVVASPSPPHRYHLH